MPDLKLRDTQPLVRREEKTALLGLISDATDDGEGRKTTIGGLAASQQRENPLSVESTRALLVSYTGADTANRASRFNTNDEDDVVANALTAGESFDDGYYAIEILYYRSIGSGASFGDIPKIIPIENFNNSEFENQIQIAAIDADYRNEIFRISATTFGLHGGSQNSNQFLKAIYGLTRSIG